MHAVSKRETGYSLDPVKPARDTIADPCRDCPAQRVGLCAKLSPACRQRLSNLASQENLPPGTIIGEEDSPARALCTVTKGVVALTKRSPDGGSALVGFRYPGEVVLPSRHDFTWPVSVSAVSSCRTCSMPFSDLPGLSNHYAEFTDKLLDVAQEQLENGYRHVLLLGYKQVDQKLAAFLLDFMTRSHGGEIPRHVVEIPMTRSQMAGFLGVRTETVCRSLGRLKTRKLLALPKPRQVQVLDRQALRALALNGDSKPSRPKVSA